MIVRPRLRFIGLLTIVRGSIITSIAPQLGVVAALSLAVTLAHALAPQRFADLTPAPFTLFGLALSIFLGFRNSACYDRWWEGRRQWGQLVAETRILAREVLTLLPAEGDLSRRMVHRAVAFAHALRDDLRGRMEPLAAWLTPADEAAVGRARSRPDAILLAMAADLRGLLRAGTLSDIAYQRLSERLAAMTSIQTACERLRSTPPPFTYTLLLHRTAWLFCLLVPFGLVDSLGLLTPLVSVVLAYTFFGLDALGDELEEPFGLSNNALPLDALVRAIEIAAAQALGDPEVPLPLAPQDFILR